MGTPLAPRPPRAQEQRGFTLVELLIALGILALMAGLSWRGLDAMVQTRETVRRHSDAVLALQAGLTQWSNDLDAMVELPQTPALAWDGRGLRLTRRSTTGPGEGVLVVAWARRNIEGAGQWLRWQSPPLRTRGELQAAWNQAGLWAQNPGENEKKFEVRITALDQWQIYYFRDNAWSHPLSSADAARTEPRDTADGLPPPEGIRLVLTLPPGEAISGTLTRDWMRATLGGDKS